MIKYKKVSSVYFLMEKVEYTHEKLKQFGDIDKYEKIGFKIIDNELFIDERFSWDGPSGAINTDNLMRASLVHDILTMIANQHTGDKYKELRKLADEIYYEISREDGVSWFRAKYQLIGIRTFGTIKSFFK